MSQELSLPVLILVQPQDQPPGRRPGPAGHAHWWQVRLHLGCLCRSGGGSCSDPCSCQEWSEKPEEGHRRLSPAPPHTGDLAHTGRLDHVLLRRWQIVLLQDEWVQWLRLQGTSQCISLSPRAIQRLEGCMINCQAALITALQYWFQLGVGRWAEAGQQESTAHTAKSQKFYKGNHSLCGAWNQGWVDWPRKHQLRHLSCPVLLGMFFAPGSDPGSTVRDRLDLSSTDPGKFVPSLFHGAAASGCDWHTVRNWPTSWCTCQFIYAVSKHSLGLW